MGWSAFQKTGLTHHDRSKSFHGYTLVTPSGGQDTLLLDMGGSVVHRWEFGDDFTPGYGRLLDNGNLLIRGTDPEVKVGDKAKAAEMPLSERLRVLGGNSSRMYEVDWDSNLVWSYENEAIHHDFQRLENGNTLLVQWVEMTADETKAVRGGERPKRNAPNMLGDEFIEVNPKGDIVWRSALHHLLDPRKDPICPLETRLEWTHVNALQLNNDDQLLFSSRTNHAVGIIDRRSGELTWQLPYGIAYHQHHATWQDGGKIQIFDNGMHKPGLPSSRIIEVDPTDNSVEVKYEAVPSLQFFSPFISSADRLPNGNILICEGATGRVFEVTNRQEVVWEWISPFINGKDDARTNQIFRAHRYAENHPALKDRDLMPMAHREINRTYGPIRGRGGWGGRRG
jgi:hypothetical protein